MDILLDRERKKPREVQEKSSILGSRATQVAKHILLYYIIKLILQIERAGPPASHLWDSKCILIPNNSG